MDSRAALGFRGEGQLGHIAKHNSVAIALLGMLLGLCTLVTESPGEYFLPLLITGLHLLAHEKSTARIYRFTLDWLSRICIPINTFTALLMPLLGINKVTADKMRLRFSWQLRQRRAMRKEV